MTIVPPNPLTAAQLIGSAVATVKTARDIIKDSSNHELKSVVSELYNDLIDIKARVLDQDEEIRRLRDELTRRDDIEGPEDPHGYFFHKGDRAKPLCPRCAQQNPQKAVFMGPLKSWSGGMERICPVCTFRVFEVPMFTLSERPAVSVARRLSSSFL